MEAARDIFVGRTREEGGLVEGKGNEGELLDSPCCNECDSAGEIAGEPELEPERPKEFDFTSPFEGNDVNDDEPPRGD
jgi:hypothetical protein